jgi:GNAT superfamily N-acetyltransferase
VSTELSLRIGGEADAGAIAALTHAAYAKWVPVIGREPLPMQADYAAAVKAHRFDLLSEGDELAALIETAPQGELLLVVNVAVRPDRQGAGYGRRLLAHAWELALAQGLAGTRLYTNKLMAANVRLYERLGYVVEREEAMNGGMTVHMVKLR